MAEEFETLYEIVQLAGNLASGKALRLQMTAQNLKRIPLAWLTIPDPFGHSTDAFHVFVRDVIDIFARCVGGLSKATIYWSEHKAGGYDGKALPFVTTCARLVGRSIRRKALGDIARKMRRVLKEREAREHEDGPPAG
jgi:hypothetical protein